MFCLKIRDVQFYQIYKALPHSFSSLIAYVLCHMENDTFSLPTHEEPSHTLIPNMSSTLLMKSFLIILGEGSDVLGQVFPLEDPTKLRLALFSTFSPCPSLLLLGDVLWGEGRDSGRRDLG